MELIRRTDSRATVRGGAYSSYPRNSFQRPKADALKFLAECIKIYGS